MRRHPVDPQPSALDPLRRRGTVLVVLVVLLLVAVSIAGAVLRAVLLDARQFATDRQAVQADRLAEAGLARAAARLAGDPSYSGEEWMVELAAGERATVVITLAESGGRRTVEAAAVYPAGSDRAVRSRRSAVLTTNAENSQ